MEALTTSIAICSICNESLNVKRECMFLAYQLLLYSIEQTAKLARALTLTPFREKSAQVQDEKPREAIGK